MRRGLAGLVLALAAGFSAYTLGDGYTARLSDPRSILLVAVNDEVPDPPPRPRRTFVIVADGLRRDAALGMRSVARLRDAGQCRPTDTGAITISRPVYAVLSTGLEQDRTGIRSNSIYSPLGAESIWELARRAGLVVTARAELPWWRELFPGGFDRYQVIDPDAPYFLPDGLGELNLIVPGWIDTAGHDFGADSDAYAEGVRRLDAELGRFLDEVDLARDLVVLSADHGHTGRGGHGGRSPEVAVVLTCFAGRGVARRDDGGPIMSMAVAPTLAILLGLPFPRHMRAGADGLDAAWTIVDASAFPASYLDGRRLALARFRDANPSWPEVYAAGRREQATRLAILAAVCTAIAAATARGRRRPVRQALAVLAFVAAVAAAAALAHVLHYGTFDLSAVNKRSPYVRSCLGLCVAVIGASFLVRVALARELRRAAGELAALTGIGLAVNVGLVWVFGAPLGFPLPSPAFLVLPLFGALFTMSAAVLLGLVSLLALARGLYSR